MTPASIPVDRRPPTVPLPAIALSALLAGFALYGSWSVPGLVGRWGVSASALALVMLWGVAAGWALSTALRPVGRTGWTAFAVMAAAFRLASLMLAAGRESPGDPHWYLVLARHLLAGQGLFIDDVAMGVRAYAEFPPAYPVILACWGAVAGLSALSVTILSTLLDLAAAMLIARLGSRFGARRAGIAAAALYLIWPSVLFDAPLAQKESLEMVAVLALAHGWLGAGRVGVRQAAAIGLPTALLALTQPGLVLLAPLFGLAVAPRLGLRRFVPTAAMAALVASVAMVPWWWRNWHVLHAFVPMTSVGGLSLWIGENPEATGNWMPYPVAVIGLSELDCAQAARRMAVAWMSGHPAEVVRLNVAKLLRSVGIGQFAIVRLSAMRPALSPDAAAALLPLTHGTHVLLLAAGSIGLLARRQPMLTALLVASIAQLMLFGVWFEFGERHRALLTPFLLLVITTAVAALRRRTAPSASPAPQPA